jgi:hypothetical protein
MDARIRSSLLRDRLQPYRTAKARSRCSLTVDRPRGGLPAGGLRTRAATPASPTSATTQRNITSLSAPHPLSRPFSRQPRAKGAVCPLRAGGPIRRRQPKLACVGKGVSAKPTGNAEELQGRGTTCRPTNSVRGWASSGSVSARPSAMRIPASSTMAATSAMAMSWSSAGTDGSAARASVLMSS